jgi:hypothetical protein
MSNIFNYLPVYDPKDDEPSEKEWEENVTCYHCGSTEEPLYGPAKELTNPHCQSGWWVTICAECGDLLACHL